MNDMGAPAACLMYAGPPPVALGLNKEEHTE